MTAARSLFVYSSPIRRYAAAAFAVVIVTVGLPIIALFSMGSSVVGFLAGTPSAEAAESEGFYMGGPVPGDTYEWGNCTYWAYAERLWAGDPIPDSWGDANTWDDRAAADGYVVDHTPEAGAVMQTDAGRWGHVAYVTGVEAGTGTWKISEMNIMGLNIVSTRTFAPSAAPYYYFIHGKRGTL